MSLEFRYNLALKKNEIRKIELPNLKSSCLLLRSFEIKSEHRSFDIKLVGKDTIISYGEAVFYQTNNFDLADKVTQIIDADKLQVIIKCAAKDNNNVNLLMKFNYSKLDEGNIIFNNVYTNMNQEGLASILSDIMGAGKYVNKIIWTSPNKLSSIELTPQFETDKEWITSVKELANNQNQIVMNLTDNEKYDPDLVSQLSYYTLSIPDNIEKLGVIVYGYHH